MQTMVGYRASRRLESCKDPRRYPHGTRVRSGIRLLGLLPSIPNFTFGRHSNALAALPPGENPKYRIAGPKLRIMDKQIRDLDGVLQKLVCPRPSFLQALSRLIQWIRKIFWNVWIQQWIKWNLCSPKPIEPKVGSGWKKSRCGHPGHFINLVWV